MSFIILPRFASILTRLFSVFNFILIILDNLGHLHNLGHLDHLGLLYHLDHSDQHIIYLVTLVLDSGGWLALWLGGKKRKLALSLLQTKVGVYVKVDAESELS